MVASEFANFSHKYIGFSLDAFIHSAGEIASAAGSIADQIDEMKIIEMTPDERGVFAQAAHCLIYDEFEQALWHLTEKMAELKKIETCLV